MEGAAGAASNLTFVVTVACKPLASSNLKVNSPPAAGRMLESNTT